MLSTDWTPDISIGGDVLGLRRGLTFGELRSHKSCVGSSSPKLIWGRMLKMLSTNWTPNNSVDVDVVEFWKGLTSRQQKSCVVSGSPQTYLGVVVPWLGVDERWWMLVSSSSCGNGVASSRCPPEPVTCFPRVSDYRCARGAPARTFTGLSLILSRSLATRSRTSTSGAKRCRIFSTTICRIKWRSCGTGKYETFDGESKIAKMKGRPNRSEKNVAEERKLNWNVVLLDECDFVNCNGNSLSLLTKSPI